MHSGETPTAQPGLISGQSPTAEPGLISGQTPSAKPGLQPGQSPTAQPGLLPGQSPTAQPGLISGQSPSAKPGLVSGQTPTAQPGLHSGETPTAQPGQISGQSPTAQPGLISGQTPTAGPTLCGWTNWMNGHKPDDFSGESELFSDLRAKHQFCQDMDIQGIECRVVNSHLMINQTDQVNVMCDITSGGLLCFTFDQPSGQCLDYEIRLFCEPKGVDCSAVPTAHPGLISGQTPTAQPGLQSGQSPTAQPGLVSGGQTPTAQPSGMSGGTPTAQPPIKPGQTPIQSLCVDGWSSWINRDTPPSDGKEVEFMNSTEKAAFCNGGKISSIECVTTDGIESYSTGEVYNLTSLFILTKRLLNLSVLYSANKSLYNLTFRVKTDL
jgi:hypothetical protein